LRFSHRICRTLDALALAEWRLSNRFAGGFEDRTA
jgi:hypothetical protein